MNNEQLLEIAKQSPALKWMSDKEGSFAYPAYFNGKVPLKARMNTAVKSEVPFGPSNGLVALYSYEYYVWVNSYGAVSAILDNGDRLGLKPGEFTVIEYHEPNQIIPTPLPSPIHHSHEEDVIFDEDDDDDYDPDEWEDFDEADYY